MDAIKGGNLKRSIVVVIGCCAVVVACAGTTESHYRWTTFVQTEGQPEPVPAEWVATPEGKFAHSIKIPNPVPRDSGYKPWMSSEAYFKHLCENEAGEFIFKTVDNVEGFYFMRPPKRPTDRELMDRYALEAPEIESLFQAISPTFQERAHLFVSPPRRLFRFVELPDPEKRFGERFLRAYGYRANRTPMKADGSPWLQSRYGLIWRGIKRPHDRESYIGGGEWIIVDLKTNETLAVRRNYGRTGFTRNTPEGIWWLNAVGCPVFKEPKTLAGVRHQIYEFVAKVIRPVSGEQ